MTDVAVHPEFVAYGGFGHLRLGRVKPSEEPKLRLAPYIAETFKPAPPTVDFYSAVPSWPMYGNDTLGDCLIEGTEVAAANVKRAYRGPYDGPVVDLETESGKRLTVTRNHAVLTARGFVRARDIQEGEYLLSSDLPQAVAMRIGDDLDGVPARVEDVFEAHRRIGSSVRVERERVGHAVQFHGDERFLKGDVHVVDADGFLENRDVAALGEPESEFGFVASRSATVTLDRRGPSLSHLRGVRSSASSFMRGSRASLPHIGRDLAGAEQGGFGHRPHLHATSDQPAAQGLVTDPGLVGELLDDLSGLVTTDRVRQVRHRQFRGQVYDLSTESHWYIANGIVTHNCTWAAIGHLIEAWTQAAGDPRVPADHDIVEGYWLTGSPPSTTGTPGGATDDGRMETRVLSYWRGKGVPNSGDKIVAYAAVNPRNLDRVRFAVANFGGAYIGLAMPLTAETQKIWDVVPGDVNGDPGSWGGHAVPILGYDADYLYVVTWGAVLKMTWAFLQAYCDACYAVVSGDFVAAAMAAGVNIAAMQDELAVLTAAAEPLAAVLPDAVTPATETAQEALEPASAAQAPPETASG